MTVSSKMENVSSMFIFVIFTIICVINTQGKNLLDVICDIFIYQEIVGVAFVDTRHSLTECRYHMTILVVRVCT